jgi:hypothetical protein
MKNNRKNRNKIKISNRNRYRIFKKIDSKAYFKFPTEMIHNEIIIEKMQMDLVSKCYKAAKTELNKWGLKNYYLEESEVQNVIAQESDDFIKDNYTLLTILKFNIKFSNYQ